MQMLEGNLYEQSGNLSLTLSDLRFEHLVYKNIDSANHLRPFTKPDTPT
jgi:hypothetical protein